MNFFISNLFHQNDMGVFIVHPKIVMMLRNAQRHFGEICFLNSSFFSFNCGKFGEIFLPNLFSNFNIFPYKSTLKCVLSKSTEIPTHLINMLINTGSHDHSIICH